MGKSQPVQGHQKQRVKDNAIKQSTHHRRGHLTNTLKKKKSYLFERERKGEEERERTQVRRGAGRGEEMQAPSEQRV